jgi:hypothetical protein
MLPISLSSTSFKYGPWEIPYTDVTGAGVAVRTRRYVTHRSLVVGYRMPGEAKQRKILFGLKPGPDGDQLVESFRSQVADRWKGEAPFFEMNTRLGFSNTRVFGIVAAIVVVTVVAVVGWAVSVKSAASDAGTRRPDTSTRGPRR